MADTSWMRAAADGIANNLGGIIHDGRDVSCELRKAADEIERLQEQVRVEKEENRWAYINAALDDKKEPSSE